MGCLLLPGAANLSRLPELDWTSPSRRAGPRGHGSEAEVDGATSRRLPIALSWTDAFAVDHEVNSQVLALDELSQFWTDWKDEPMDSWLNVVAAGLAVLGALIGLSQYFNFRSKRERHAEIGRAFADVVAGLGSASTIERLANAALLRRFWDRSSEYGKDLPYAEDAVKVAAAILKQEPTGPVQKLLADELRTAPSVAGRSYQRANLRDAYWGANLGLGETPVQLRRADFFRADLSLCSLKNAHLQDAQFREAHLVETILVGADCTGANFEFANLRGAKFKDATLSGARFKDASHVPPAILERLNDDGVYEVDAGRPPLADANTGEDFGIFISAPSVMSASDSVLLEQLVRLVSNAGALPRQFLREDYGQTPPLEEITRRVATSRGVLVFGPTQLKVSAGLMRGGTPEEQQVESLGLPTPWNQVEAGIAVGLGKPLLIVSNGATGGVFDLPEDPGGLNVLDLTKPGSLRQLDTTLTAWVNRLDEEPVRPTQEHLATAPV